MCSALRAQALLCSPDPCACPPHPDALGQALGSGFGGFAATNEPYRTHKKMAPGRPMHTPADAYSFPEFARDQEERQTGKKRVPPPTIYEPPLFKGKSSIAPVRKPESDDPYAWMGARPGKRPVKPMATEVKGSNLFPAHHATRRFFPEKHEQRYQCWRPETLGNVSQWSDGPGVYNLVDPAETKGAQVPYITDGRGGRKLFKDRREQQSYPFRGPTVDQHGKPIDFFLAKNGGSLRTRLYANEDIDGQNPYLLFEQQLFKEHGLQPPPPVVHPSAPPFNARGETLSQMELR